MKALQFHRNTEQVNLEGISGDHHVQSACSKKGYLEEIAQGLAQLGFEYLQGQRLHILQYSITSTVKKYGVGVGVVVLLCFNGICCISICANYLLYFHGVLVRRPWLYLLYSTPSVAIYRH